MVLVLVAVRVLVGLVVALLAEVERLAIAVLKVVRLNLVVFLTVFGPVVRLALVGIGLATVVVSVAIVELFIGVVLAADVVLVAGVILTVVLAVVVLVATVRGCLLVVVCALM